MRHNKGITAVCVFVWGKERRDKKERGLRKGNTVTPRGFARLITNLSPSFQWRLSFLKQKSSYIFERTIMSLLLDGSGLVAVALPQTVGRCSLLPLRKERYGGWLSHAAACFAAHLGAFVEGRLRFESDRTGLSLGLSRPSLHSLARPRCP